MADEPAAANGWVLAGVTLAGGLSLFGLYIFWVPELRAICESLSLELTAPAILMFKLADIAGRFWFAVLPAVIIGPLPPLYIMSRGKGQRVLAHMALIQLLVALFTAAGVTATGIQIGKLAAATRQPPAAPQPAAPR